MQTVKANPGIKWVRSLVEKFQFVAVELHGAYQNTNVVPLFRRGTSSRTVLVQGLLHCLGHGQEGREAQGTTAVVKGSGQSWGLEPSLVLTAQGTTAGRDCYGTTGNHCKTSWCLQLSEIFMP